jgi:hypothetical protein
VLKLGLPVIFGRTCFTQNDILPFVNQKNSGYNEKNLALYGIRTRDLWVSNQHWHDKLTDKNNIWRWCWFFTRIFYVFLSNLRLYSIDLDMLPHFVKLSQDGGKSKVTIYVQTQHLNAFRIHIAIACRLKLSEK